ncbi:MAG: metallopeptidase TldD-related protein [Actinomycetota bacterium]
MTAVDADWFDARIVAASSHLNSGELLHASLHTEDTDFVRFNHAQVRQAGTIAQTEIGLDLIEGTRHAQASVQLTGQSDADDARIAGVIERLRELRSQVPEDPHLITNDTPTSTHRISGGELPETEAVVASITERGAGQDLVGIYASGTVASGFASSRGQRNWFETSTFDFDWTRYLQADKAVKSAYAGFDWDNAVFDRKLAEAGVKFEALKRSPLQLDPGEYRTLLTPSALEQIMELLAYNAFGIRAQRSSQSSLLRLVTGEAALDERVRISEHTSAGVAPNFQEQGWLRPDEVVLVEDGQAAGSLVSPRSAKEFEVEPNGAAGHESPESLAMAGGTLADDDALAALDTGLWVGNLWYTNYSDLPGCRVTGMTRFATFWVEGGEIVAPVEVLRFDDTLYNLLGERLIDLTAEPELLVDNSTYEQRISASMTLPGALIDGMRFTL